MLVAAVVHGRVDYREMGKDRLGLLMHFTSRDDLEVVSVFVSEALIVSEMQESEYREVTVLKAVELS